MFEQLKDDFLKAVNAKEYTEATLILKQLEPYLSESQQKEINDLLTQKVNEALDQVSELSTQAAVASGDDSGADDKADDDQTKADLTKVDWGGITGAALGGVAAIINATNGTTPDNISTTNNTTNNSKEEEKDNRMAWYIGGGVGLMLLIFILLMLMKKKPK